MLSLLKLTFLIPWLIGIQEWCLIVFPDKWVVAYMRTGFWLLINLALMAFLAVKTSYSQWGERHTRHWELALLPEALSKSCIILWIWAEPQYLWRAAATEASSKNMIFRSGPAGAPWLLPGLFCRNLLFPCQHQVCSFFPLLCLSDRTCPWAVTLGTAGHLWLFMAQLFNVW